MLMHNKIDGIPRAIVLGVLILFAVMGIAHAVSRVL
jgi:hypothetical protein